LQHFKINHQQAAEPLAVISAEVHAPLSPVCAPPLPPLSNVALEPVLCSMPQIHHDKVTANIIPEKKKKEANKERLLLQKRKGPHQEK
jgi:hypothetical protein